MNRCDKRRRSPRLSGFTLLELLVVMAIIALLMTLLAPGLSSVRESAQMVRCKRNLSSLAAASMLYAGDHRGEFPCAFEWVERSRDASVAWSNFQNVAHGSLWPYMGEEAGAYVCHVFARIYTVNPSVAHLTPHATYVMNEYFRRGGWIDTDVFTGRRSQVLRPASLGLFAEENPYLTRNNRFIINNLALGPGSYANPASDQGHIVDGLGSFHRDRGRTLYEGDGYSNVAFADGHVGARHASQTKETMTPLLVKRRHFPGRY